MFAVNAARVAAKAQSALTQSCRQMSVVSGPPQVRISPAEKAIHGVVITLGIMAIPMWVLVNIKHYRAED